MNPYEEAAKKLGGRLVMDGKKIRIVFDKPRPVWPSLAAFLEKRTRSKN